MKTKLLLLCFALGTFPGFAQEWEQVISIPLTEEASAASIDQDGRIYVGTVSGNLHRFSADGTESEFFSAIANFPVTSLATWNRLKCFVFYRDPQEFYYLDRFNTLSNHYRLSEYDPSLVWLCAPGVDNSLWVLNTGYNELRKYNEQNKQLQLATPLSINLNAATHLRAYQNLLIISDSTQGIYIFDQYGNLLQQMEITGVNYFQILDRQLLLYAKGYIYQIDIYHLQQQEKIKAPEGAFIGVFRSGGHYICVEKNRILIYLRTL